MKLAIGVIKEAARFKQNVRYDWAVYTVSEIQTAITYYNSLDREKKLWFENLRFDRMMWWSRNFVDGVPKSPKELKKERGDKMRARRAEKEKKNVAQVRS